MLTELRSKLEKAIRKHKNIPLKYLLKFFFKGKQLLQY